MFSVLSAGEKPKTFISSSGVILVILLLSMI